MAIAALVLVGTIDVELNETGFAVALAVFGIGAGLLAVAARQRDHVRRSTARQDERGRRAPGDGAEPRRLARHRAHRLRPPDGPAHRLQRREIEQNPAISDSTKAQIIATTENGIEIVTTEQVQAAVLDAGATPDEADAITADYGDAQLEALKKAMLAVALLALRLDRLHAAAAEQADDAARAGACRSA